MAGSTPSSNAAFGVINPFEPVTDVSQLSLANGMTAGYGDNDGNTSNPPLPWATPGGAGLNPYGGSPMWPPKRVGVMTNVASPGQQAYFLYFLYNPNEIQVSFSINTSQIPATILYSNLAGTNPVPALLQSQTVSWTLFFDRTYDMLYDTNPGENRGVLKDTAALYNILGSFNGQAGVPQALPVQVVFGQSDSGQLWGFTGFVSSVSIDYGIFRHNMIPSNCQVQLALTAVYVGPGVPTTTTSSTPANDLTLNSAGINQIGGTATATSPEGPPSPFGAGQSQSVGPGLPPTDVIPGGIKGLTG